MNDFEYYKEEASLLRQQVESFRKALRLSEEVSKIHKDIIAIKDSQIAKLQAALEAARRSRTCKQQS